MDFPPFIGKKMINPAYKKQGLSGTIITSYDKLLRCFIT